MASSSSSSSFSSTRSRYVFDHETMRYVQTHWSSKMKATRTLVTVVAIIMKEQEIVPRFLDCLSWDLVQCVRFVLKFAYIHVLFQLIVDLHRSTPPFQLHLSSSETPDQRGAKDTTHLIHLHGTSSYSLSSYPSLHRNVSLAPVEQARMFV